MTVPKFERIEGYRYFNFALLHTRGYSNVFDMLRYDRAFLCRKQYVEDMKEAAKDYVGKHALKPRTLLICRYDWRGKTKPNFTPNKLLSNQEYEMIDDPQALYDLNSDVHDLRPSKPLKIQAEVEITAQLPYVLDVMYANRAVPSTENDARSIEGAFSREYGDQEITVKLVNFANTEQQWTMP